MCPSNPKRSRPSSSTISSSTSNLLTLTHSVNYPRREAWEPLLTLPVTCPNNIAKLLATAAQPRTMGASWPPQTRNLNPTLTPNRLASSVGCLSAPRLPAALTLSTDSPLAGELDRLRAQWRGTHGDV